MRARLFAILPLLLAPAAAAAAQDVSQPRGPIDRGSWLVSGGASFIREERDDEAGDSRSSTSFSIFPNALYFVVPRLAVGGQVGYGRFSADETTSSSWSIGPAVRYYFGDPRGRVLPYLGASVMRDAVTYSDDEAGIDADGTSWTYDGLAGLTFMLTRHVGISAEGFVTRAEPDGDGGGVFSPGKATAVGIRFGVAAFVIR